MLKYYQRSVIMEFKNLKIKKLDYTIRYSSSVREFSSNNGANHIIGIQLAGSAKHSFDTKNFTIEKNCIYFLNQKENYDVKVLEATTCLSIHFQTYEPIDTESFCIKINNPSEVFNILEKIDLKHLSTYDEHLQMSDFYTLCSLFNAYYNQKYFPKNERLDESISYLKAHFTEKNCLEHAAFQSGLSRRRFNDIFKNHYGITPNKYLTNLRIEHAKKLLMMNELTVSDVAMHCGFSDIYYFSKVFKKETGINAKSYSLRK